MHRRFIPFSLTLPTFMLALTASAGNAGILYVDLSAPAGGDGASWTSAFNDLGVALGSAFDGDEVRIAQGVYHADSGTKDRSLAFSPRSGVTMRGGYRGLAPGGNPEARDPRAFVTVLSGDLAGDDADGFLNRADNTNNIIYLRNVERVVIEGLTIRGGDARITFNDDGGGINAAFSKFIVRDCLITDNRADRDGGGICLLNSFAGDIDVVDCFIVNNASTRPGGGIATYATSPRIINCYIGGNYAPAGAGLYINTAADVINCTVIHNVCGAQGGGVGGGLYNNGGTPVIVNSIFRDNVAGGAQEFKQFWNQGAGTITVRNTSVQGLSAYAGNGNVDLDPGFVNLAGDDGLLGSPDDQPRLPAGSPLIGLGDASALPNGVTTDLFGGPRLVGDALDLGADEFGCMGDTNGDGVINFADLNTVLTNFGVMTDTGDVNGDGVVNFGDLNIVLSNFGVGCGW